MWSNSHSAGRAEVFRGICDASASRHGQRRARAIDFIPYELPAGGRRGGRSRTIHAGRGSRSCCAAVATGHAKNWCAGTEERDDELVERRGGTLPSDGARGQAAYDFRDRRITLGLTRSTLHSSRMPRSSGTSAHRLTTTMPSKSAARIATLADTSITPSAGGLPTKASSQSKGSPSSRWTERMH